MTPTEFDDTTSAMHPAMNKLGAVAARALASLPDDNVMIAPHMSVVGSFSLEVAFCPMPTLAANPVVGLSVALRESHGASILIENLG